MADGIVAWFDTVSYPGDSLRLIDTVMGMASSATRTRPGIRAGGGLTVTVGGSPEAASVAPGAGVITDTGAGVGSWLFVIPATVSKNLATRPAAGQSRLDEVVARINSTTKEVEIAVITGTASAGTPTAPTVPAGNLLLNELVVPATGTISVQSPGRRTTALGGILPVASQAERDAIEVIYDGLIVYREDTDKHQGRVNGAWLDFVTSNLAVKGTADIVGDGDSRSALTTVTFPAAFTALLGGVPPLVTSLVAVPVTGGTAWMAGVEQLSTTQMKLAVWRNDGGVFTSSQHINVHYRVEVP